MSYIIPVRQGEELNQEKLESFLRNEIRNLPDCPLEVNQFGTGASNLTYALKVGDWEAVLRRAPLGPVAPKAHDMEREYKILSVLSERFPFAPIPYLFCEDHSIVGKPFILMERKKGVLVDTTFPNGIEPTPELARSISELMVNTLVELHSIPYKNTLLEEISRPEGFLERQVTGWLSRYEKAQTEEVEGFKYIRSWLPKRIPETKESTIIHYDYKLNNALFSNDLSKMIGLFDWEMSTVGDPLLDLSVAMTYWMEKNDPPILQEGFAEQSVTVLDGFYTRKEFIQSYSEKSGRDISNINFYLTFAYFKLATICQQIYYRYKKGQTNDQRFARFGDYSKNFLLYSSNLAKKGWEE